MIQGFFYVMTQLRHTFFQRSICSNTFITFFRKCYFMCPGDICCSLYSDSKVFILEPPRYSQKATLSSWNNRFPNLFCNFCGVWQKVIFHLIRIPFERFCFEEQLTREIIGPLFRETFVLSYNISHNIYDSVI